VLVAIEGIDGSGKTTLANFLKDELEKLGYKAALFKEPTDSKWGKMLKKSYSARLKPEVELELFLKDRAHDVEENIIPALKEGKIVIMDRYYISTIAYQGALGFDLVDLKEMNEKIAPKPDLVFILDISPEKAVFRVRERGDKPNDFEKFEYLKKVREIFLWCGRTMENAVLVNAERDIGEVKREVLGITLRKLRKNRLGKFSNT